MNNSYPLEKELQMYTHIIKQRGKLLGLPSQIIKSVNNDFKRWVSNCGLAYTVDRFKSIKQCIIKYYAEGAPIPADFYIKRRIGSKHFMYGHYGQLQDMSLKSKKHFRKVLLFLNLYTVITSKDGLTKHLALKHKQEIEEPQSVLDKTYCEKLATMITPELMAEIKQLTLDNIPENWEESKVESYRKKMKLFFHKSEDYVFSPIQKEHQENSFSYDWHTFMQSQTFARLYENNSYRPFLNSLVSHFPHEFIAERNPMLTECSDYTMANINLLEQPGLKYRYVAAFKKPLEHIVKPIGDMLYDMAACLPWDITFHEEKCFLPIMEHLQKGGTAHSVDLKSATDRFPWIYQRKVAENLFPRSRKWLDLMDLYDELIHLPASYSGCSGITATWEVGQPLGSYPSFAIFTVTHGVMLYLLNNFRWDGKFWIHGDDIVILDDELALRYKSFLSKSGVKTSPQKTVTSNKLAEINSKIITTGEVIITPKWKPFNDKNIIEMVRHWGPKAIDIAYPHASYEKKMQMRLIASLPIVGADSNPMGLSLDDRCNGIEELLCSSDDRVLAYQGSTTEPMARRYSITVPTYAIYGKGCYRDKCYQRGVEDNELRILRDLFGKDFSKLFRVVETAPKYKTDPKHFREYLNSMEQGVLLDRAHLQLIKESLPSLSDILTSDGVVWTDSTILELFKYNLYTVQPHLTLKGQKRRIGTKLSWQERNRTQMPRLNALYKKMCILIANDKASQTYDSWSKEDKMESSPVLLTMQA